MLKNFKLILRSFLADFTILISRNARIAPSSACQIIAKNPLNLNLI